MKRFASIGRPIVVLALAVVVAACSNTPRPQLSRGALQSTESAEIEAIALMLDQGHRGAAMKRITANLKRDPGNANLMLLRDSIVRNPVELLGPSHISYTVLPGDTMSELAQRFLGNRLKSYQLARYNGIERPTALSAGQVLRIPREPLRVEPVRHSDKAAEPQPPVRQKAAPAARAALAPPAKGSVANAAAARQARSAGLTALNEGNPARAVGLLSRAAALDPGNAAIARDLQRARRINATVRSRQ